jgi:hypothetical protein
MHNYAIMAVMAVRTRARARVVARTPSFYPQHTRACRRARRRPAPAHASIDACACAHARMVACLQLRGAQCARICQVLSSGQTSSGSSTCKLQGVQGQIKMLVQILM